VPIPVDIREREDMTHDVATVLTGVGYSQYDQKMGYHLASFITSKK